MIHPFKGKTSRAILDSLFSLTTYPSISKPYQLYLQILPKSGHVFLSLSLPSYAEPAITSLMTYCDSFQTGLPLCSWPSWSPTIAHPPQNCQSELLKCKSDHLAPLLKITQSILNKIRIKSRVLAMTHKALHDLPTSYLFSFLSSLFSSLIAFQPFWTSYSWTLYIIKLMKFSPFSWFLISLELNFWSISSKTITIHLKKNTNLISGSALLFCYYLFLSLNFINYKLNILLTSFFITTRKSENTTKM